MSIARFRAEPALPPPSTPKLENLQLDALAVADVRALLRLVSELRELGNQPSAWRAHLARALEDLCDCRAVLLAEVVTPQRREGRELTEMVDVATRGIADAAIDGFVGDLFWLWFDADTHPALAPLVRLYPTNFTGTRSEIITDAEWYASSVATERFARHDCDDFIVAFAHGGHGATATMGLYRSWGGRRFGARERALVEFVNDEIAKDIATDAAEPRLGPRARAVLAALETGASEKEIAASLNQSPHTTHDHVKAIYRTFNVRTRPELMSKLAARRRARVCLSSH